LYYLLNSEAFRNQKDNNSTGATQKAITLKGLKKIKLKIPEYHTQDEIGLILDNIDQIIKLKEQQLSDYDQLIKSRFVEMFGDSVRNPMRWETKCIKDIVSKEKNALKAGPFGSALKKEYYQESGYKIYGQEQVISGNVEYGDYYISENRYKKLVNCAIKPNDVLISLVGTYGKLLIMPKKFEPGIINPRLMKITFDSKKINTVYFKYFFQSESLMRKLTEKTHGGTMPILNLGIVKNVVIPVPPLVKQNQFAEFVNQVDKLKFAVQKSLEETQILFDSLMQKYFG
jgi:type I restriction enzyme S subunit